MIRNVCITTSTKVLFLYFLLQDDDVLNNTFFFLEECVPEEIRSNIPHQAVLTPPNRGRLSNIFYVIIIRILRLLRYRFIKNATIYGQDNVLMTSPLIGNLKMTLLEDGLINYKGRKPIQNKYLTPLKRILLGKILRPDYYGYSESVEKIILTGLAPIPSQLRHKVTIVDIYKLWNGSNNEKKEGIKKVFGIEENTIMSLRNVNAVLFTQPLSEDGAFSEKEKIDLYRKITKEMKMAIKPHPRETTNYKDYFPDLEVLPSYIPVELFSVLGVKFSHVYTVFSTAVFGLPYPVEIHFVGTRVHQALVDRFGDITMKDGELVANMKF